MLFILTVKDSSFFRFNFVPSFSVIGNFMKSLWTCLISMAIFMDQISFETRQKLKINGFNWKKIVWKYSKYFGENQETNQNFITLSLWNSRGREEEW